MRASCPTLNGDGHMQLTLSSGTLCLLLSLQQSLRSVKDDDFCLCKDNTSTVADFRY